MDQIKGQMRVLVDVLAERKAQDAQWGGPSHDDAHSADEFIGFIDSQIVRHHIEHTRGAGDARARLVKIAALAFAAIESIDRKAAAAALPVAAPRFVCSTDGETYGGDEFETREAAIAAALDQTRDTENEGCSVWVGEMKPANPLYGIGSSIEDVVIDQLYDQCGEFSESFRMSPEQVAELDALVSAWGAANLEYGCFSVENDREYVVDDPEYQAALQPARAESGESA